MFERGGVRVGKRGCEWGKRQCERWVERGCENGRERGYESGGVRVVSENRKERV